MQMSMLDTRYLNVPVTVSKNPTNDVVQFAFKIGPSRPSNSDWQTGAWQTPESPYVAQLLIGPENGGYVLAPGIYAIWLKIIDNPEIPVLTVGSLTIF